VARNPWLAIDVATAPAHRAREVRRAWALIPVCLAASAEESRHLIVVSDANGIRLWVEGNPSVRLRAADSMNLAESAPQPGRVADRPAAGRWGPLRRRAGALDDRQRL
jgi:hypothetical protein